jgi:hypothetical protein
VARSSAMARSSYDSYALLVRTTEYVANPLYPPLPGASGQSHQHVYPQAARGELLSWRPRRCGSSKAHHIGSAMAFALMGALTSYFREMPERTTDRPQKPRERMRTNVHERDEKRRFYLNFPVRPGRS